MYACGLALSPLGLIRIIKCVLPNATLDHYQITWPLPIDYQCKVKYMYICTIWFIVWHKYTNTKNIKNWQCDKNVIQINKWKFIPDFIYSVRREIIRISTRCDVLVNIISFYHFVDENNSSIIFVNEKNDSITFVDEKDSIIFVAKNIASIILVAKNASIIR